MRFSNSIDKPVLIGEDALNLHMDENYIVRRPIKYGSLNVIPYIQNHLGDNLQEACDAK